MSGLHDGNELRDWRAKAKPLKRRENSMTRVALLERLKELQGMPKFQKRDICTVSAFLPIDALAKHVALCEEAVGIDLKAAEAHSAS